MENWKFDDYDRELAKELQGFLPDMLFDMHAHPYFKEQLDVVTVPILEELPPNGGIEGWKESIGLQVGKNRLKGGLFFGLPIFKEEEVLERMREGNRFVQKEVEEASDIHRKALMMISSLMEPSEVENLLKSPLVAGFKPYINLSPGCSFETANIPDYLPEWALELAEQKELVITLHMAKPKALNDSDNQREIKRICRTYPHLKLVLAHCACAFNMYSAIEGIRGLPLFDNLWFDTAVVCEGPSMIEVIRKYGADRVMWGTDYPVSVRKGKIITLGDMHFSVQSNTVVPGKVSSCCNQALIGMEQLRAMKYAIRECNLKDREIEDLFYHNAMKLLSF